MGGRLALSYVLPLRSTQVRGDLDEYLEALCELVDVVVVDGSAPAVFEAHERRWPKQVRHVAVDCDRVTPMGKVGAVLTGLEQAASDFVVVADDDVRWDAGLLAEAARRLRGVDLIRPQNCFRPVPWHARWDTGRILINRALDGDWPGTLVIDRRALGRTGGYDGGALFENLELVRTIKASGGTELVARDLFVPRTPPTVAQFFDQRVRQAYDEFARPWRLLVNLGIGPTVILGGRRAAFGVALSSVALAEVGRRRAGGRAVFGPTAALWAPCWVAERAVTSWLALLSRLRYGGVRYRGTVLRKAATPMRELRRAYGDRATAVNGVGASWR
ncbi:MAG: glycosyltransferase [Actinomycetota bacterium]|nr:glycosyltransferase [Actinomycetota bacterium]